jgi:hypothetical protein
LRRAGELGLDPAGFLRRNDSYRFYEALGGYLRTGPTNTNVCDFMLALVQPLRDRDGRTGPQAGQRRTRPTQGSTQEVFGYTAQ